MHRRVFKRSTVLSLQAALTPEQYRRVRKDMPGLPGRRRPRETPIDKIGMEARLMECLLGAGIRTKEAAQALDHQDLLRVLDRSGIPSGTILSELIAAGILHIKH